MKALISDLDGTLLNAQGQISKNNLEAIQLWRKKDMFVIASGRSLSNIRKLFHSVELKLPIIALNGAIIFNDSGKVIFKNVIKSITEIIMYLDFCEKYELIYTIYGIDESYTRFYSKATLYQLARSRSSSNSSPIVDKNYEFYFHELYEKSVPVYNYRSMLKTTQQVLKIEVLSENNDLLFDARKLTDSFTITSSSRRNIEITEIGSNKGAALLQLAQYYHIDTSKFYAIGDGENDLPMFNVVGTSFAMANAQPIVKEQSTFVTNSNIEDGVANAIEKILSSL